MPTEPPPAASSADAATRVTPATPATLGGLADKATFLGVLLCFVVSGFAALLYQTAWMRQFSGVFGTSELAVATVLAAYMAGLALGAALAGRFAGGARRPVLVYGWLELGVALGALAVPFELRLARALQAAWIGGADVLPDAGGGAQTAFYLGASFVVILVPTTFMGATLPLLTRHVVRRRTEIGTRVGLLYGMNTAGAVAGALVAAFVLLPRLGLGRTVTVGVALNGLVFLIAAALARFALPPLAPSAPGAEVPGAEAPGAEAAEEERDEPPGDARARWILPLVLVSGSASFGYEVVWTRLLAHVVGGSVRAFAVMLASFLTGITLGSLCASLLARSRRASAALFALCQLGVAGASAWVFGRMDGMADYRPGGLERALADWLSPLAARGGDALADPRVLGAFLLLLPATFFLGATFPFALRTLARSRALASRASARVYAWNTVGAILGALLAGFWIVPGLGFAGAVRALVLVNAALAVATGVFVLGGWRRPATLVAAAAAVALGIAFRPVSPDALLRYSMLEEPGAEVIESELLFQAVGRSATVSLFAKPGSYVLRSNGLPEAEVRPAGASPFGRDLEHLLAVLPVVARPSAKRMLMVGFGGGVALERIPPSIEGIDVVELEPEILAANRVLSGRRAVDPLADRRLRMVTNDVRGALALTDARWDIVVSQPSHPWTAGASHLYTREFLVQVKEHLNHGGVLVQWMQAGFLTESLLRSLGATLRDVFPHVRLYRPAGGMLVFLASDAPLDVEREVARTGEPFRSHPEFYRSVGVACLEDVVALLALEPDGLEALCAGAAVSTDDENLLAMHASPRGADNLVLADLQRLLFGDAASGKPTLDPLLAPDSPLVADLGPALDRAALARRMLHGLPQRAILSTNVLADPGEKRLAQGWAKSSLAVGDRAGGAEDLQQARNARPEDVRARYALLRDALPGIARGERELAGLVPLAEGLTGTAHDVWLGQRCAARGAWTELAALEPRLAAVRPSDLWFLDSLYLRALERVKRATPQAREALALADQGLVREPDPRLYLVRLAAAELLGARRETIETLFELSEFAGPGAGLLAPDLAAEVEATLRAWKERVAAIELDHPEEVARRAELGARLAERLPDAEPPPDRPADEQQEFR